MAANVYGLLEAARQLACLQDIEKRAALNKLVLS